MAWKRDTTRIKKLSEEDFGEKPGITVWIVQLTALVDCLLFTM